MRSGTGVALVLALVLTACGKNETLPAPSGTTPVTSNPSAVAPTLPTTDSPSGGPTATGSTNASVPGAPWYEAQVNGLAGSN